nr:mitochondrial inner membrane i-aaa protease supercomplex subunit yme1 [Quercus suber]
MGTTSDDAFVAPVAFYLTHSSSSQLFDQCTVVLILPLTGHVFASGLPSSQRSSCVLSGLLRSGGVDRTRYLLGTAIMAFSAPASDMWPAMKSVFKVVRRSPTLDVQRRTISGRADNDRRWTRTEAFQGTSSALKCQARESISQRQLECSRLSAVSNTTQPSICNLRGTIRYTSPPSNLLRSSSSVARSFPTSSHLGLTSARSSFVKTSFGFSQQRTLFGTTWGANTNRNLLAHLEQTATNNPGSATAQNAFYQALMRANMPEILVERYQTGRYASNAACENVYMRALERVGAAESGSVGAATGNVQGGQNNQMSPTQLQSIGQAVSANRTGSNMAFAKSGTGAKNEPLYVVVDESTGAWIFKLVRFIVVFGMIGYGSLVILTLLVDATGMMKKVSSAQNAEAKPELQTTKFSDVHGCEEAKEELQELVEFLKDPTRFSTLGGKLPKGVLLSGPPGTGKTLLARAVAGEAGVPFFYMSGSEFDEVFVGVGAKRVRDLFSNARGKSPAIVFIDELDAIGSKRQERDAAYAKQTLNQLLTELDGFDQNSGVIVIGATNFPQSLDKALTRPGRFDRNVVVPLPDVRGRIAILKHFLRNIRTDTNVDPAIIARGCIGFSGAELESVVNQAAVRASKNRATKVSLQDLNWAKDKIIMGAERRSAVIQQKDKISTAYHEGGHALVAMFTEGATPLYKATIMPRGHSLGHTSMLPELDKVSETKKELLASIDVSMGGKVAEEIIYGPENVSTGASSDIQNATRTAFHMAAQAGMSDKLGNVDLATDYKNLSSQTKQDIESEVRRLVEEGRDRAMKLLTERRTELDRLATALVEYETLDRDEMERVVRGEKLPDKLKVDPSAPIKFPEPTTSMLPPAPQLPLPGFGAPGTPGSSGSPGGAVSS